MRPDPMMLFVPAILGVVVQIIFASLLHHWGTWVAARQGNGVWWRRVANAPVVAFVCGLLGIGLSLIGFIYAFRVIETAEASEKSEMLANAISHAMIPTVVFLPIAWLLYLTSIITFIVGTIRKRA